MRCTFTSTKDVIFMSVEKHSLENECFPGDRRSRAFEEDLGSSLTEAYATLGPGAEVTVCHLVGPDLLIHPNPQYSLPLHDLAEYWSEIPSSSDTTYSGLANRLQRLLEKPVYLDSRERRAVLKDFSTGEDMSDEVWYVYLRQFTSHEYLSPIIPLKGLEEDDAYRCIIAVRGLAIIGHTLCGRIIVNFFYGASYYAERYLKDLLPELCPDKEIIWR